MKDKRYSRRTFLGSASTVAATSLALAPAWTSARGESKSKPKIANSRLQIGCIGLRYQGTVIADKGGCHGEIVALCDVDKNVREQARASFGSTPRFSRTIVSCLRIKIST